MSEQSEKPVFDLVTAFLSRKEWSYRHRDYNKIYINFSRKNANHEVILFLHENEKWIRVVILLPLNVSDEKKFPIMELITRINYKIILGNFQMDLSDGELLFSHGIDIEGGVVSDDMLENLISIALSSVDRFYPAIMKVVYADEDAFSAFEHVLNNSK